MEKIFLSKKIEKILENIDYSKLGEKVGIKVHFGEKGCNTYLNPEIVKAVYNKIKSLGKKVALIECNVLYRGSRTNAYDHVKTAMEHGFTDMDIDILDGDKGEEFIEVDLGDRETKKAKLGKGLKNYDSMIVLSHFKGHMMAGFGGAFKNIGMGLGSRAGKLHMHSNVKPSVRESICSACGTCIDNCNAKSIKIMEFNGKARIDEDKCEGCAMCISVCPQGAVSVPWSGATKEELQKRIVDYTRGVFKIIPKEKIIYINVLENITEQCDCMGVRQEPIMEDIGILVGYDVVAIDKASFDLVEEKSNGEFSEVTKADETQIDYACELGLGCEEYEVVGLDEEKVINP